MDFGPSFAKYGLENRQHYGLTEVEVAFLAGTLFAAGSDTVSIVFVFEDIATESRYQTYLAICTILMVAACFPEEQAKIHAKLDAVIGRHQGNSIPLFRSDLMIPLQCRLSLTKHPFSAWKPSFWKL